MISLQSEGDDQVRQVRISSGMMPYDSVVRSWLTFSTSEDAKTSLVDALRANADELCNPDNHRGDVLGRTIIDALMLGALQPPAKRGFWDWLERELPRPLGAHLQEIPTKGGVVRFDLTDFVPPRREFVNFGSSGIRPTIVSTDPKITPAPHDGRWLWTGQLTAASLELRGPETGTERRALEDIVATFGRWVNWHLSRLIANESYGSDGTYHYFFPLPDYFPLVELLAQRLAWGPPGEVLVPPSDEVALERAASLVKLTSVKSANEPKAKRPTKSAGKEPDRVLARLTVMGWTLVLEDDLSQLPFGAYAGISLIPPGSDTPVPVLTVDPWSPPSCAVVDGVRFRSLRDLAARGDRSRRAGHHARLP